MTFSEDLANATTRSRTPCRTLARRPGGGREHDQQCRRPGRTVATDPQRGQSSIPPAAATPVHDAQRRFTSATESRTRNGIRTRCERDVVDPGKTLTESTRRQARIPGRPWRFTQGQRRARRVRPVRRPPAQRSHSLSRRSRVSSAMRRATETRGRPTPATGTRDTNDEVVLPTMTNNERRRPTTERPADRAGGLRKRTAPAVRDLDLGSPGYLTARDRRGQRRATTRQPGRDDYVRATTTLKFRARHDHRSPADPIRTPAVHGDLARAHPERAEDRSSPGDHDHRTASNNRRLRHNSR